MEIEEQIAADASMASAYYKMLLSMNIERADALEITKTYVMSKLAQQVDREQRVQRQQEQALADEKSMVRGGKARSHFSGQHSPATSSSND